MFDKILTDGTMLVLVESSTDTCACMSLSICLNCDMDIDGFKSMWDNYMKDSTKNVMEVRPDLVEITKDEYMERLLA